ncbi:MAG: transglycosylase SLT domain-containing protein [Oligoflexia bacterium]|nr:transglycosylase SLT domain-containing protein [Oligoflexia bacterium]
MTRKLTLLTFCLFTLAILAHHDDAFAAKKKKHPAKKRRAPAAIVVHSKNLAKNAVNIPEIPAPNQGPVDELIEKLYAKPSPRKVLIQLRKAAALLDDQKFDPARRAAALVQSDPDFGDYARWLAAEAAIIQAEQELKTKHFDRAKAGATETISPLAPVPAEYPSSPTLRFLPRTIGRARLVEGRVACEAKKWAACRKSYEEGFTRLMSSDAEAYIRPADIQAYVQACSHHGTENCPIWLQRMAANYSHGTAEFKVLESAIPDFLDELPKPSYSGRITTSYHAPDPDSVAFDDAMSRYLDHKEKDSIPLFRKFLDEYPRSASRFRAKYWLSQAMLHEKMRDDAHKLLADLQQSSPLSYYGLLAAIANGADFGSTIDDDSPIAQDFDPLLSPLELLRLRRAQTLISQKIYEPAALELSEIRPRDSLSTRFLIYLAALQSEAGAHYAAFKTLSEIAARGSTANNTSYAVKMIFPDADFKQIKKIAEEFRIDPVLVLSLVKQESAFDRHAMSSTGALGLMQLMPTTASDTVADLVRADLTLPEVNLRAGTKYLAQLLKHYNGNIVYALAAYNAGPGAVNRWIKGFPPERGMTEFIENIAFRETREYVGAIIRNYYWYTRLLSGDPKKTVALNHFWGAPDSAPPAPTPSPTRVPVAVSSILPSPTPSPSLAPSPSPAPAATLSSAPSIEPSPMPSPRPSSKPFGAPQDDEYGPHRSAP